VDVLTYLLSKKYTDKAIADIIFVNDDSDLFDRQISVGLLLNYIRQNEENWNDRGVSHQTGTVTLTNSEKFPFNNSKVSVSLNTPLPDTEYAVICQIKSASGNPGEIEVSDKLVNGFKLNCTGSASSVVVDYIVIGGFTE